MPTTRLLSPDHARKILDGLGWHVILARADQSKAPITNGSWQRKRNRVVLNAKHLADAEKGKRLIAIVPPKDIVVIDIDRADGIKLLEKYSGAKDLLASTLSVKSGDGFHLYYVIPKNWPTGINLKAKALKKDKAERLPKHNGLWKKVDIRANGYMVAPPSLHWRKEHHYSFVNNGHTKPQKIPRKLLEYMRGLNDHTPKVNGHSHTDDKSIEVKPDKKEIGKPQITTEVLRQVLDRMPPSVYAHHWQEYHSFAASIHYACAGSNEGRDLFLEWAASDPEYDTPKHRKFNRVMWKGFKLNNKAKHLVTHRTLVAELKKHSTLPAASELYRGIGKSNVMSTERAVELFGARPAGFTKPLKPVADDPFIDVPGYSPERVAEVIAGSQEGKEGLIAALLNGISLHDTDFTKRIFAAVFVVEKMDDDFESETWLKRIIELSGMPASAMRKLRKDVKRKIAAEDGREMQDVVSRATQLYAERNEVIASMGQLYERNKKTRLYKSVSRYSLEASILDSLRKDMGITDRENVVSVIRNAVDLLSIERNVDKAARKWIKRLGDKSRYIIDVDRIPWQHNNIFQVYSDMQLCHGVSVMNLRDAEVSINWSKHLDKIRKQVSSKRVFSDILKSKAVADLFTLPIDIELSAIKGVVTTDRDREKAYYLSTTPIGYIAPSKATKDIANSIPNFIKYLSLVTEGLQPQHKREFISCYLDMLAYIMQPVRHSAVFFLLHGKSGGGKSFAGHLTNALTPPGVIHKSSMLAIANNERFGMRLLDGKYLVYEDDAKGFNRDTITTLKEISHGNEILELEAKHENNSHTYLSRHVVSIMTNVAPRMNDASGAIERRAQVFQFHNSIANTFDRFKNGVPVINDEIDIIHALLRLRLPRILSTPEWRQPDWMIKEAKTITRSDMLSITIENSLVRKAGSRVDVDDLTTEYKVANQSYGMSRTAALPFTTVCDRLREFNYAVEGTQIIDAALVSKKPNKFQANPHKKKKGKSKS